MSSELVLLRWFGSHPNLSLCVEAFKRIGTGPLNFKSVGVRCGLQSSQFHSLVDNAKLYKVMRSVEVKSGGKLNIFNRQSSDKFLENLAELTNSDASVQRTVLGYALKQYYTPAPWLSSSFKTAAFLSLGLILFQVAAAIFEVSMTEASDEVEGSSSVLTPQEDLASPAFPLPSSSEGEVIVDQDNTLKGVLIRYYGYYLEVDKAIRLRIAKLIEWLKGI